MNDAVKTKFFESLKTSLIGCEGGNVNASLWFCGIEWGEWGESRNKDNIQNGLFQNQNKIPSVTNKWMENNNITLSNSFDSSIAKIVLSWKGKKWLNDDNSVNEKIISCYSIGEEAKLYRSDGDTFKLNLFPLAAKSVPTWTEEHYTKTGCFLKSEYYGKCIEHRFPQLLELKGVSTPKVIVCIGRGFINEYKYAFWGEYHVKDVEIKNVELNDIKIKNVELTREVTDKSNPKIQIQIHKHKDLQFPIIVETPFFGYYKYCVKDPLDFQAIGKYISDNLLKYPDVPVINP